jgi:hypothetical protein
MIVNTSRLEEPPIDRNFVIALDRQTSLLLALDSNSYCNTFTVIALLDQILVKH